METPIGTVFNRDGKFWKVIGGRDTHGSYPVIRCNKNGKEFKDKNGFAYTYVDKLEWKAGVKFAPKSDEKVSQAGIENGKKKRRLKFLLARMQSDRKEAEQLVKELIPQNQNKD